MLIHKCIISMQNFDRLLEDFYGAKHICFVDTPIIPEGCCFNCVALEKVFISKHTKEIGSFAFKNCVSLKCIYIPKSLKRIHTCAFDNCINLSNVYFY